jgi:hypothetical protein
VTGNPEELSAQFAEALVAVQKGLKNTKMLWQGLGYGTGGLVLAFLPSIGNAEVAGVTLATVPLLTISAMVCMYSMENGTKLVSKAYSKAGGVATEVCADPNPHPHPHPHPLTLTLKAYSKAGGAPPRCVLICVRSPSKPWPWFATWHALACVLSHRTPSLHLRIAPTHTHQHHAPRSASAIATAVPLLDAHYQRPRRRAHLPAPLHCCARSGARRVSILNSTIFMGSPNPKPDPKPNPKPNRNPLRSLRCAASPSSTRPSSWARLASLSRRISS